VKNMAERDRNNFAQDQSADDLDRVLDAALARYASVEPRPGLEQRVMANLSAPAPHTQRLLWWRWGVAAVLAIVLVVAGLAWKSSRTSHPAIANHAPGIGVSKDASQENSAKSSEGMPAVSHAEARRVIRRRRKSPESANTLIASAPKREQFPSPQPLSDEELALAHYASYFPSEARVIARAQEEYARESQQQMRISVAEIQPSGSEEQER
jgi:hypothetical protein